MHKADWYETLRRAVLPPIGQFLSEWDEPHGLYAKLKTHPEEFAFVWHEPEADFEERLHYLGFVRNPLAAWKTFGSTNGPREEGSWAWRGNPKTWARNQWADGQLHVILFETEPDDAYEGTLVVCAHWEHNWLTHPWAHYRGKPTKDAYWGLGDTVLREMFEQHFDDYAELSSRPAVEDLQIE